MRFSVCCLGCTPGVGFGGAAVKKYIFLKHGHVAYQIDGNDE